MDFSYAGKLVVVRGLQGPAELVREPLMSGVRFSLRTTILPGVWGDQDQLTIYPRPTMGRPNGVFHEHEVDKVALARTRAEAITHWSGGSSDGGLATPCIQGDVQITHDGVLVHDPELVEAITNGTFPGSIRITAAPKTRVLFVNYNGLITPPTGPQRHVTGIRYEFEI